MTFESFSLYNTEVEFGDARINLYLMLSDKENGLNEQIGVYHNHFYYECHLLTEGEEKFELADTNVTLGSSQMLIIPPALDHYSFSGSRGAKELVLAMTLEKTDGESGFYSYFDNTLAMISEMAIDIDETLCAKIEEFCHILTVDSTRDFCKRKTLAYDMIYSFFDSVNHFNVLLKHEKSNDKSTLFMLDFLVNDLNCSLSEISQKLGYTPRHTSRMINRIYGKSLSEVRLFNMTATAKRLLVQEPSLSLAKIAQKSGFSSLRIMNREFFAREGVSPSEYRKKLSEIKK